MNSPIAAATLDSLIREVRALQNRLSGVEAAHNDLRDRHARMLTPGTVGEVDAANHQYRQVVGKDENDADVLGPWRPYSQHAGALKLHTPPSKGQQMLFVSPNGDFEQGVGFPFGWSTANPSPSQDGATVAGSFDGFGMSINGGVLTITGKVVINGDFTASGGVFKHKGKNVGDTHTHSGVQTGGGNSGAPV